MDGHELSKAELDASAENMVILRRHKLGDKANTKANSNSLERLRKTFVNGYAKVWVENTVLADYAAREGVVVSNEWLEVYEQRAFANFKARGDKSYEDLLKLPGLRPEFFQKLVRAEALQPLVRDHLARLCPTNLPDSYVDDVRAAIARQNERMAATNVLQYAKATNVWEKLKSGADFAQMAKEFSEIEEEAEDGGDWLVVDEQFLSDEPVLLAQLKAMKPGEFTPPIAADNGIMIARLDRLEDEGGFAVSRVYIRLAQIFEPAPAEEIIATALRDHADRLFKAKLDELVQAAHAVIYKKNTKGNGK